MTSASNFIDLINETLKSFGEKLVVNVKHCLHNHDGGLIGKMEFDLTRCETIFDSCYFPLINFGFLFISSCPFHSIKPVNLFFLLSSCVGRPVHILVAMEQERRSFFYDRMMPGHGSPAPTHY